MEPTGSQRLPSINLLNLRAEKRVKLRKTEAAFQLDLFNATNSNVTSSVIARSGSTYGNILSILPPRIARVGVTFSPELGAARNLRTGESRTDEQPNS